MLLLPAVNNLTLNWEEALPTQAPVKTAKKEQEQEKKATVLLKCSVHMFASQFN